jgi:hypothetical protein
MRARAAAVVVSVALLAACSGGGGDDDDGDSADGPATSTTAPLHADERLPDGRHFGQVTALDPSRGRIVFDEATLRGEQVLNPDDRMRRYDLADDVVIRLLDPCCELSDATLEEWLDGFEPDERSYFTTSRSYYWITLEDQTVVAVDEQLIPQD